MLSFKFLARRAKARTTPSSLVRIVTSRSLSPTACSLIISPWVTTCTPHLSSNVVFQLVFQPGIVDIVLHLACTGKAFPSLFHIHKKSPSKPGGALL